MNLLDFQQLADGTLAAYPYIVPAPKCEFIYNVLIYTYVLFVYMFSVF